MVVTAMSWNIVLGRLYREAPLNSIWEGSGNVICLDVLRALSKEPDAYEVKSKELATAAQMEPRYDALLATIDHCVTSGQVDQFGARRFVELLARALQSCMLLRHGADAVTKACIQTRLSQESFGCFGTYPWFRYRCHYVARGCSKYERREWVTPLRYGSTVSSMDRSPEMTPDFCLG